MANSINKPKKAKSKRGTVRLRHKIEKASNSKQRKARKQAKKNPEWVSKHKKDPGIPNSFPYKEQLLEEIELQRLKKQEDAKKRREQAKAAKTGATSDLVQGAKTGAGGDQDDDLDADLVSDDEDMLLDDDDDEDDDGADDDINPMAALLASARRAAKKYQKEQGSDDEMDDEDDDDDDDSEDDNGAGASFANLSSRKAFDKVFKDVVEQADVVLYVLDARDPEGTRSRDVERSVMNAATAANKRLIFVLNKVDLVPATVLKNWLAHLRRSFPTLPFRASGPASSANTFTHNDMTPQKTSAALFHALKSFAAASKLHRAISVGVVGYPNVGKSSVINALLGRLSGKGPKSSKACPAGAEAGVTTSIRRVKIDSKLTLLDSPGIVFPSSTKSSGGLVALKNATEARAHLVLLNAIPPKQIDDPVPAVTLLLRRLATSPDLLAKLLDTYNLPPLVATNGDMTNDFLIQVARKRGRLGKGGVPNINAAAMTVVTDWRDGRIQGWVDAPTAAEHAADVAAADAKAKKQGTAKVLVAAAAASDGPDQKQIVTEWAKEFKIEGLWGDDEAGAAGVEAMEE